MSKYCHRSSKITQSFPFFSCVTVRHLYCRHGPSYSYIEHKCCCLTIRVWVISLSLSKISYDNPTVFPAYVCYLSDTVWVTFSLVSPCCSDLFVRTVLYIELNVYCLHAVESVPRQVWALTAFCCVRCQSPQPFSPRI